MNEWALMEDECIIAEIVYVVATSKRGVVWL
jgi:hypothetical protein